MRHSPTQMCAMFLWIQLVQGEWREEDVLGWLEEEEFLPLDKCTNERKRLSSDERVSWIQGRSSLHKFSCWDDIFNQSLEKLDVE